MVREVNNFNIDLKLGEIVKITDAGWNCPTASILAKKLGLKKFANCEFLTDTKDYLYNFYEIIRIINRIIPYYNYKSIICIENIKDGRQYIFRFTFRRREDLKTTIRDVFRVIGERNFIKEIEFQC